MVFASSHLIVTSHDLPPAYVSRVLMSSALASRKRQRVSDKPVVALSTQRIFCLKPQQMWRARERRLLPFSCPPMRCQS